MSYVCCLLLLVCATHSAAERVQPAAAPDDDALRADELLLVFNGNDAQSRALAEYYARVRNVPADRLCSVSAASRQEEISRELFDQHLRRPVREYLEKHDFGKQVRCIVLFYGLPIRVGALELGPVERRTVARYPAMIEAAVADLHELTLSLESITSQPTSRPAGPRPADIKGERVRYGKALAEALQRLAPTLATESGQQAYQQVVGIVRQVEGVAGLLARSRQAQQSPEQAGQLAAALKQLEQVNERITELREQPLGDAQREKAWPLIRDNYGLLGLLEVLARDVAMARTEETVASVDSEMTLVWADRYPLHRWIPNALNWRIRTKAGVIGDELPIEAQTPTLMVCRIDGPTPSVARRIIDHSIAAEKTGLEGRVYLDARGMQPKEPTYGVYDADLRELATLLQRETSLAVLLDNRPAVFGIGARPRAMLYCGWYSLRDYISAFQFMPGAVGYHIASFEAVTIKTPGERGWVRNLLLDGVDATLGPVAEPYLQAFPRPTRFFGLLLTGRFTLAQCFAYTSEFNSWMMLLIGDPLYRPFAARPALGLEQVYPLADIPPEFRDDGPARDAAATEPAR